MPLLAQMEGDVLDERLHRWSRYCARMLGSAVHKKMLNGAPIQVAQIPNIVDEHGEIIDVGNDMNLDNFLEFIIDENDVPPEEDVNAPNNPNVDAANAHNQDQPPAPIPQDVFNDGLIEAEVEPDSGSENGDVGMLWAGWNDDDEDW